MAKLAGMMRTFVAQEKRLDRALTNLNRTLTPATFDGRFITLVMVILDPSEHTLTVVNAGHMPPLVRRRDGRLEEIGGDVSGLPLLIDGGVRYRQHRNRVEPGDSFLLFTDGVNEMMNPGGEQFGVERLRQCVSIPNPAQVGEQIVTELQRFGAGRPAQDDVCLVCCGRSAT